MHAFMNLDENTYGKLINIAGRQRMLSQRIGFLFLSLSGQTTSNDPLPEPLWSMLTTALEDFKTGYRILLEGDPDQDLPQLSSARINTVLTTSGGAAVIERFLNDVHGFIAALESRQVPDHAAFSAFSSFVLTDLLETLQAIVMALESDLEDDMHHRHQRRAEEAKRVTEAIQEIQKASRFSRMIALNAKISADRAGPYGKEFGALTEELKNISIAITTSSENLLRHLEEF